MINVSRSYRAVSKQFIEASFSCIFVLFIYFFFVLTEFLEINTNVLPTLHMETLWERFNGSVESQTSLS